MQVSLYMEEKQASVAMTEASFLSVQTTIITAHTRDELSIHSIRPRRQESNQGS